MTQGQFNVGCSGGSKPNMGRMLKLHMIINPTFTPFMAREWMLLGGEVPPSMELNCSYFHQA